MNRYLAQHPSLKEKCDVYDNAFILLCTEASTCTLFSSGPGPLLIALHDGYHVFFNLKMFLALLIDQPISNADCRIAHVLLISLVLNLFVCLVIAIGDGLAKAHSLDATSDIHEQVAMTTKLFVRT